MTARAVIGLHPSGDFGIFVSRPGFDAMSLNPGQPGGWALNSTKRQACVLMSGGVFQDTDVLFPAGITFLPYVWFEHWDGGSAFFPSDVLNQAGTTTSEGASRFTISQSGGTSFRIIRRNSQDTALSTYFRYAVFNFSIAG